MVAAREEGIVEMRPGISSGMWENEGRIGTKRVLEQKKFWNEKSFEGYLESENLEGY